VQALRHPALCLSASPASFRPARAAALLAVPGLLALVWDPTRWLWLTWRDPSYQSDGRGLQVTLDRLDLSLQIHPEHLHSALRNLLDNAFRHGEGKPVELHAFERAGRVVIRVRDRGPGISEGNRERIFQRFFTTERDRGGTGLGLVIARAVAKTRGGDLSFETSGEGTCFELAL